MPQLLLLLLLRAGAMSACVSLRVSETGPSTVLLLAAVSRWLMGG